jgi:transposase-like protein
MSEGTTSEAEVIRLRQSIETQMRRRILEAIELVLEEELTEALGTSRYERGDARRGYRNGHQTRRITTRVGAQTLDIPRGRIVDPDGARREFRSQALPRYARRTREVDEAILGAYGREHASHPQGARAPAGRGAPVEERRVAGGVETQGAVPALGRARRLAGAGYAILFLDGFHLKVRMARRVVSVPVLAVLGVAEDGRKHLVALQLAASEAGSHWSSLIADLQRRGSRGPCADPLGRARGASQGDRPVAGSPGATLHLAQVAEPGRALPR